MQVTDLSAKPFVARELMLIKVRCNAAQRRELSDLADIFHGTVCDVSLTTITLELQGKEDKMHALQGLLEPYGEKLSIQSAPLPTAAHIAIRPFPSQGPGCERGRRSHGICLRMDHNGILISDFYINV
jgi:hypothetical protein